MAQPVFCQLIYSFPIFCFNFFDISGTQAKYIKIH